MAAFTLKGRLGLDSAEFTAGIDKANRSADYLINQWTKQANIMGMSAREAKIYEMRLRGASDAKIAELRATAELLDKQEAMNRAHEAAARAAARQTDEIARLAKQTEEFQRQQASLKRMYDDRDSAIPFIAPPKTSQREVELQRSLEELARSERESAAISEADLAGGIGGAGSAGLAGMLSKRGPLGQLASFLRGGGAVAGITLLAKEMERAAKAASDMALAFDRGEASARDVAAAAARSVPVVGSLSGAITSVADAVEDWAYAAGLVDSPSWNTQVRQFEEMAAKAKESNDALDAILATKKDLDRQFENAALDGYEAQLKAVTDAHRDQLDTLERSRRMYPEWSNAIDKAAQSANRLYEEQKRLIDIQQRYDEIAAQTDQQASRDAAIQAAQEKYNSMMRSQREQAHAALSDLGGSTVMEHAKIDALYDLIEAEEKRRESIKKTIQLQEEAYEAAQREAQQIQTFADSVIRDNMTPLEKFTEQLRKMDEALMSGFLGDEDYRRGLDRLLRPLESVRSLAPSDRGAPLALQGSREDYEIQRTARSQGDKAHALLEAIRDSAGKSLSIEERIAKATEALERQQSQAQVYDGN